MKKFSFNIITFFILLILSDLALGGVFKAFDLTKGGQIHKVHSIMTKTAPDLLILGSSRASHHYDTSILRDSLGISVFNAGLDGQGTAIAYGFLKGVSQRKYPEYLICELTPEFDLYDFEGSVALNVLNPYINNIDIKNMIIDFNPTDKWKLISNAYRLNSYILRLLPSILLKRDQYEDGYQPLYGKLKNESNNDDNKEKDFEINPLKEKYLRKLIEDVRKNDSHIIFTISPKYNPSDSNLFIPEIRIAEEYGIPVINRLSDRSIVYNPDYFQDPGHMNYIGTEKYTQSIIHDLKLVFNLN